VTVFDRRAAAVLYHLLRSRPDRRPFLVPANACPVVAWTFLAAEQPFCLIDLGADLTLDRERALALLDGDPDGWGGILFVRTYGALDPAAEPGLAAFFAAARALSPGLLVIDDRCLCRPEPSGTAITPGADVTLYSTGYAKHVDLGWGGFAHLAPQVSYRRHDGPPFEPAALEQIERRTRMVEARRARWRGQGPAGWLDLRAPELPWEEHAREIAPALAAADAHKERLNAIYREALPPEIQLPAAFQHWRFQIQVPRSEELVATLFDAGLFASRHYASLGGIFGDGHFPRAEALHARVVNLFNDRYFSEAQAEQAAALVRRHLGL
jgi:hypothetical protein